MQRCWLSLFGSLVVFSESSSSSAIVRTSVARRQCDRLVVVVVVVILHLNLFLCDDVICVCERERHGLRLLIKQSFSYREDWTFISI